ncbi:SRF [Lepeophtheirus salmonis]|uniref:SRF n=1 Tax=Lepeophtheirus salmonis TaxID=72036 RepID=A0A7R8HFJ2_LEPSM|nr:SRF [Lepeophtheirus salmonis]CAF3045471.1 SRF [Lepeophtheirus salmonis]
MLLVASETGHVYTFATRKLQPMITSDAGKALIQTCLNSPDPSPLGGAPTGGDQRMSATGYEETELTYNVAADEESQKLVDDEHPTSGTEDEEEMMEDDEEPVVSHPPNGRFLSERKKKEPREEKKGRGGNGLPKIKVPLLENLRYPLQIPTHASTKTDHISRNEGELADTPLNMVTSYITSHPPHPSTSGILKKEIILKPPKSDSGG